ncbi:MAG: hypothetical protein O9346_13590 [Leptospiraceae bacterium]|nr:hypothetical protein [Leptospiraceae bacterium]MCZ8347443.1 hypothetical protein [Leptospiraceae bacterium]
MYIIAVGLNPTVSLKSIPSTTIHHPTFFTLDFYVHAPNPLLP